MGMLVDVNYVVQNWPLVLGAALFAMLAKVLITGAALLPFRLGGKTTAFSALGMVSIGEFSFVLAQAGRNAGVLDVATHNLVIAASLPTILLTPGAFFIAPRVDKYLANAPLLGKFFQPNARAKLKPAVLEKVLSAPHAIVVGYGRVGRRVARGLRQAGLSVVVVEQDWHLVRELRRDKLQAIYGDASYPSVVEAAQPHNARIVIVALPDFGATRVVVQNMHRANPNATIVARAQRPEDDARLRAAGATAVVVPEFAGAFLLLEEALLLLGLGNEPVFTGTSTLAKASQHKTSED
jgi:CPA2 family monovalent cation:H+ antiporter-2